MAGAGGVFILLIGVLIGVVAGVAALVLFGFGFSTMRPDHSRVVSYLVGGAALVAMLMTMPAWFVILSGKTTRGEPFDYRDVEIWSYVLLVTPFVTLLALVRRLLRGFE